MTANEDVVLTRLSLSTEIIPRYICDKPITAASKYCLPFILRDDLRAEEQEQLDRDEARTMLNSVVMLSTQRQNSNPIPILPTSINNVTVDRPQTIFLTVRMFPQGQKFHLLSRLYLDSIIDQDLLYELFDIKPADIDKSNIISYLSSMFLSLQNNPNHDHDIEVIFQGQELETFIRNNSLESSHKWGSIHSRRLARVLFIVCVLLSPIMPFDIFSQECAKIFEPVKKEKLNALFYFIEKRDIFFGLHAVTNGSLAETFTLACACAGIPPITLLQICSYMAPFKERRFIERNPVLAFIPTVCPNIPEIQAITKKWVNLVSLRFNGLLPPTPSNVSFDVGMEVFHQLGLNNLKDQTTNLKSAVQTFLIRRDLASRLLPLPPGPSILPALDYGNSIYQQLALLRALQANQILGNSVLRNPEPVKNEAIRSMLEINQNINFNNSPQPSSSTSSPMNNVFQHSQFESQQPFMTNSNFNAFDNSMFNQIPSTSSFSNVNNFLPGPSVPLVETERSNNLTFNSTKYCTTDEAPKKMSALNDRKPKKSKAIKKEVSANRINQQHINDISCNNFSSSHFLHAEPSSSTTPLENILFKKTPSQSFVTNNPSFNMNNLKSSGSSQFFQNQPCSSSSTPLGNNLLGNIKPALISQNSNGNSMNLNHVFNVKSSTSFSPQKNNLYKTMPFFERMLKQNNDCKFNSSQPHPISLSNPSTSFSSPKNDSTCFLSTETINKSFIGFQQSISSNCHREISDPSLQAGSSRTVNSCSETLSINCNNFKLNHLVHINTPLIPIQSPTNQNSENTQIVNSDELNFSDVNKMNDVASIPPLKNQKFKNSDQMKFQCESTVSKSFHFEAIEKNVETSVTVIEPIYEAVTGSCKACSKPKVESKDFEDIRKKSKKNELGDKKIYADVKDDGRENKTEKIEEYELIDDSEDVQDFELLIETSYEPLLEETTSELIVEEEENSEVEDELVDPDNCPVKCICGFNHLEHQTIFCEKCRIWKHIKCLKAEKYANSENEYCCPDCQRKRLPLSPSEAQDLVAKSLKLEHLDNKTKQCQELKLFGGLELQWKSLLENSGDYKTSKVGKLIYEGRMRWAVVKRGQAGRILAGFGIKAGKPVIGVNGIAAYMTEAKNYCTCYRNLNLSFIPEPIIIEMKGRNGGLAHEILPSCRPNCEIKFCVYKNNLYCYLVALCEIDDDDELTIPFPDNDSLHVDCAESSSECTDICPSQKFSLLTISRNEPPSKKLKRL